MKKENMSKPNSKNAKSSHAYRRANGTFLPGTHWRKPNPLWTREWLEREYTLKKRSSSEIAEDLGCTQNNVLYFLSKYEIKTRSMAEIRRIKKWGLSGKANGMYGRCGSKNPRWIDGSSPERQRMYAQSFWKEIIRAVYGRGGYRCKKCNASHGMSNRLHAHHIKPWAGNPGSRFVLSNIVTLCNACHNWVHSKKNKTNEYLSS